VKIIVNYNPERKRRVGRPKASWIDAVDNDMRKAGVRNLRMEAKHRVGWWRILEEAKAHLQGCGATDDDTHLYMWRSTKNIQYCVCDFLGFHDSNVFKSIKHFVWNVGCCHDPCPCGSRTDTL
jgi:hypothetical protein